MPRQKVTFAANIPTQVVLDGAGELQPSNNGAEEYRYFLAANRIMWVPPEVHRQIEHQQAREGDCLTITKSKPGKAAAQWIVEQSADEPNYGYSGSPSPTRSTPPVRETTDDRVARALASIPPPQQRPALAPPQAEAPLTTTDRLAGALAAAIDAATEASIYAARKGLTLAWNAGDIRALAATLYIEHSKGGR